MSTEQKAPVGHGAGSAAKIRQLVLFGLLLLAILGLVWEFAFVKPRFSGDRQVIADLLQENQVAGMDGIITDTKVSEELGMKPAKTIEKGDSHKLEIYRYRRGILVLSFSHTVGYVKAGDQWMITYTWENDENPDDSDWIQETVESTISVEEMGEIPMPSGAGGGAPPQGGNGGGRGGRGGNGDNDGGNSGRPDADDSDDDASDDDSSDDDSSDDDSSDDDSSDDDSSDDDSSDDDSSDDS